MELKTLVTRALAILLVVATLSTSAVLIASIPPPPDGITQERWDRMPQSVRDRILEELDRNPRLRVVPTSEPEPAPEPMPWTASIEGLSPTDTAPTQRHPNRRMNEVELQRWIEEYNALGGANDFELELIDEVNRLRSVAGLPPLEISPVLMMASRLHSQLMAELDFHGHTDPFYPGFIERVDLFTVGRFPYRGVGENIGGAGSSRGVQHTHSPIAAIHTWQRSRYHWGHIFTDRTYVGFGVVPDEHGVYRVTFMTSTRGISSPEARERSAQIGQENLWQAIPREDF